MVQLTADMKEKFAKAEVFPVATASKDGVPNVAPMKTVWLMDDETVWIVDNFMKKTLANLQENPRASIYVWGPETKGCLQIKGDVEIKTSGAEYDEMRDRMKPKLDKLPAKSLVVLKIAEVYNCTPGADAGKKLI